MVTELGIVTDVSAVAKLKAKSPIVVTELGIVTDVSAVVPLNAKLLILVTEFGIVTEVSAAALKKAYSPILVSELGIVIEVSVEPWKAELPIPVTPVAITTAPEQLKPADTEPELIWYVPKPKPLPTYSPELQP